MIETNKTVETAEKCNPGSGTPAATYRLRQTSGLYCTHIYDILKLQLLTVQCPEGRPVDPGIAARGAI